MLPEHNYSCSSDCKRSERGLSLATGHRQCLLLGSSMLKCILKRHIFSCLCICTHPQTNRGLPGVQKMPSRLREKLRVTRDLVLNNLWDCSLSTRAPDLTLRQWAGLRQRKDRFLFITGTRHSVWDLCKMGIITRHVKGVVACSISLETLGWMWRQSTSFNEAYHGCDAAVCQYSNFIMIWDYNMSHVIWCKCFCVLCLSLSMKVA